MKNKRARVIIFKRSFQLEEGSNQCGSTLCSGLYYTTPMSKADLTASVECREFGIDDTNNIDHTAYSRIRMNVNQSKSQCAQVEHLKAFMRARNRYYNQWCTKHNNLNGTSCMNKQGTSDHLKSLVCHG